MVTSRMARAAAAVFGIAVAVATAGCSSAAPDSVAAAPKAPAPLRILVTNDDGWSAPGIVALREAPRRAGNTVVEVAPADDQSGSGAALTLTSGFAVKQPSADPNVWSVAAHPADAALVGLRSVMASARPDLVVSGINSGNNVSRSAIHSGTIGAA